MEKFNLFKNKWFYIFLLIIIFVGAAVGVEVFEFNKKQNLIFLENLKKQNKIKNDRLQTTDNFDKTILTYGYGDKTLELSLKEIRDAFKKEFDKINLKCEHYLLFSIDKDKNIEKIHETTDNKSSSVSPKINYIQEFNEKILKNKKIIGFFEVHNHPNIVKNVFSPKDEKIETTLKTKFKEKFNINLFFDGFIYFQWHNFGGDKKHYLNNVDDIFNKKIKVD